LLIKADTHIHFYHLKDLSEEVDVLRPKAEAMR
jgi:hypothetical protein